MQILNQIEGGSKVYTDGWLGYDNLAAQEYVHETVNHIQEYVRGKSTRKALKTSGRC